MDSDIVFIFKRLNEIKRIESSLDGWSLSERMFIDISGLLLSVQTEEEFDDVLDWMVIRALAHSILGGFTENFLRLVGDGVWLETVKESVDYLLQRCPERLYGYYGDSVERLWKRYYREDPAIPEEMTGWLETLCRKKRAGYSRAGGGKLIPYPRESQADHCLLCAVYAVLLSRLRGTDARASSLMALYHHLFVALLPDIDHEMEQLINADRKREWEERAMKVILNDFPVSMRDGIAEAVHKYYREDGDPSRAVVLEADIIDRVLQVKYYERTCKISVRNVIDEYGLLNVDGLDSYQRGILKRYGLMDQG